MSLPYSVLATVFGLGILELWAAIPAGLAMKLHPLATGTAAAVGAILGAVLVVLIGKPVRDWVMRRHGGKAPQPSLASRVWKRHGVAGLGLVAPIVTGAPLGTALGISLGAPLGPLIAWMTIGIAFWTVVLTVAAETGLTLLEVAWPWLAGQR